MTELPFGLPSLIIMCALALSNCDGLRPDFGKGTPIYRSLAYKCMDPDDCKLFRKEYIILVRFFK